MPPVNYVCASHQYTATGGAAPGAGGRPWADVLFGQVSVPILGRSALVAAGLELGFTSLRWQHT
jgi:hypothetical protein